MSREARAHALELVQSSIDQLFDYEASQETPPDTVAAVLAHSLGAAMVKAARRLGAENEEAAIRHMCNGVLEVALKHNASTSISGRLPTKSKGH